MASLETGLNFVDYVDAALAANHLARGMALLGGLDGRDDFHGKRRNTLARLPPVNGLLDKFKSYPITKGLASIFDSRF